MTDTDKQTLANGSQEAGSEGNSQTSGSLDDLLAEFDQGTSRPQPKSGLNVQDLKEVVDFVRQDKQQKQQDQLDKDIDSAFETLTEDEDLKRLKDAKNGKDLARGLLEAYAMRNPGFAKAFEDRNSDPKQWVAALGEARGAMKEWLGELGAEESGKKTIRDDLEAAQAAVSGMADSEPTEGDDDVPPSEELMNMSDVEYRKLTEKLGRKAARV